MFAFWREDDLNFLYVNSGKLSLRRGSLNPANNQVYCHKMVKMRGRHATTDLENNPGSVPASPTRLFVLNALMALPFFL